MKHTILSAIPLLLLFLVGCGEDENQVTHNQGIDCLQCHSFTSGATIYKSLTGANYDSTNTAQEYNIQLLLETGEVITYSQGNGYGNKLYNGDAGAINNFTARVIDAQGKIVNQSATNSHNVGRLACNSCHTSSGLNNAPGRIVNYDYSGSLAFEVTQNIL